MNDYPVVIYNTTKSFHDRILTNFYIKSLHENIQFIDLCKIKNVFHTFKPWIGITDSLNCTKIHLDYYISRNMNMIITTSNIKIQNIPHGIIKQKLYLLLEENNNNYKLKINSNLENISSYVIYIVLFLLISQIIIKLLKILTTQIKQFKQSNKIKTIQYKETSDYTCCTICLEDFELNGNVSILHCNHIYHPNCIYKWIQTKDDINNVKCPNCNININITEEYINLNEPLV